MTLIGEGESGKVYLNYCETTVSKFFKKKSVYEHEKHILSILTEKNICNHAEIVSYNDDQNMIETKYITNKFNTTLQNLCGTSEFCEYDRDPVLMNNRVTTTPITIARMIYKILLILDSLHKHEIIHGDFKDKNIMLGMDGKSKYQLDYEPFVIDFDLCVVEFDDYDHLYELMCDDLHKMKILIIQLICNESYITALHTYKYNMGNIKKDTPYLYKLLSNKKYNLDKLVEYFMIKSEWGPQR